MTTIDFISRNQQANDHRASELPASPGVPSVIVTCIDARTDPVDMFGLRPGGSSVFRTIGGRLTRSTIGQLGMLAGLAKALRGDDLELDVAIVHHNECGASAFSADEIQRKLATTAGVGIEEVAGLAIVDPAESVANDIEVLASSPLPDGLSVTGYVYDVTTGLVSQTAPRSTLGSLRKPEPTE